MLLVPLGNGCFELVGIFNSICVRVVAGFIGFFNATVFLQVCRNMSSCMICFLFLIDAYFTYELYK